MKTPLNRFALAAGLLTLAFAVLLWRLFTFAIGDELFSYIPLMPFISGYLVWTFKAELPREDQSSPARVLAALLFAAGAAALTGYFVLARSASAAALEDSLASGTLAWLLCLAGAGCWFLGGTMRRALACPFVLLLFMIPFPVCLRDGLETALQHGSAAAADWMFVLSGTPVLCNGLEFQLSDITIKVAPECSGIHSTWVLLITSLVAARLILSRPWNRALLCLAVLPLALLRNGFRVFVLGQLCIHVSPRMIDSPIHHRGGPLFFVLSLVPFFLLLYFLRNSERAAGPAVSSENSSGKLVGKTDMKKLLRISSLMVMVGLAGFAGTGCTAKAKKAYHLSRADRYYDAGTFQSAEIEYRNVLRLDQENAQACARLGLIYYDQGRLQNAGYFLMKASQLAPENLDLRLKLGLVYSSMGLFSNALVQANFVLDRKPQDDEAPILLADASVLPNDVAAARQRLQALARDGDRAALEVALGNLALREHDVAAATNAFNQAQKLDPKAVAVNAALATMAWARGDLKGAAVFFQAAADASPIRSPRRLQSVRFKIQTGDRAGARAALADILKAAPDYVPASLLLAELAFSEKHYDECAGLLDQVQKLDPGNYDALLFQGQLDLAQGKPAQAVADMERMARLYSKSPPAQFQLGVAYLTANQPDKAAASFEQALKLNPDFPEATLRLAELQIKSGNADVAIAELERLGQKQPGLVPAQLLLADAYRQRNRASDALAIYQAVEARYPTNAEVALLHAATLFQLKDDAGARKAYERVLELVPGYLPAIEALVDISLSEKNFDAATQLINREIQKTPKRVALRLVAANNLLAQGKREQAEAAFQQVLEMEPTNQVAALMLAQVYASGGQLDKALAKLNGVLAANPTNTSALMLTAQVHSAATNYQAAAKVYEKLLKLAPKFSPALNNLAYLYSENLNNLDRAYELAQRAHRLRPSDPSTADTLGWIVFKRGSYDAALGLLKESAGRLTSVPEAQFHLGMAAYMVADEATARAALQRAWQGGTNFPGRAECQLCLSILDLNPATADATARALLQKRVAQPGGDPVALLRLAHIYQRDGNSHQALAAYESLHQALPRNVDVLVNLAQLYAPKNPAKAYELAKDANNLVPYDPQVSHTLGRVAFLSGDYELAASVLQQALQSQPNDAGLLFDFAQAAYAVGKVAQAQTALQSALGLNLPAAQATQARRMSDLIALAANPKQAAAAGARLAEILKTEPDDVPALMARAAASESTSDRAVAEQACEKVLARYPKFIPAQQQLAQLYAADGKLERASALAQQVHDAQPDDPAAAKLLGVILVQRGDYRRALALLKESAFKLNADPEVRYYLGAAQFHLKDRSESKASLQSALALKLSGPLSESAKQMLAELK